MTARSWDPTVSGLGFRGWGLVFSRVYEDLGLGVQGMEFSVCEGSGFGGNNLGTKLKEKRILGGPPPFS